MIEMWSKDVCLIKPMDEASAEADLQTNVGTGKGT